MALRDRLIKRANAPTVARVASVAVANIKKEDTATRKEDMSATIQPLPALSIPLENNNNEYIHKINILSYARADNSDKNTFATATVATVATLGGGAPGLQASGKSERPSCFSCRFFNGKGAYWPGRCNLGGKLTEIDFNVVDVAHGCQSYEISQKPEIKARVNPEPWGIADVDQGTPVSPLLDGGMPVVEQVPDVDGSVLSRQTGALKTADSPKFWSSDPHPEMGKPTAVPISEKVAAAPRQTVVPAAINCQSSKSLSTMAVSWLLRNRQGLKAAGWSCRELYRRNISPGILFSPIWEKPFLKVTLLESGAVEFEYLDAGRACINTARPMPQRKIESRSKK